MLTKNIHATNKFEKEVLLMKKAGKDLDKFRDVVDLLLSGARLPANLNDHPLKGSWQGYRDLHIEPDWVLIYKSDANNVWLVRTGTHSKLFG